MPVPVSQMWTVASYVVGQRLRGRRRYPLVLMLEPLFRCNLACAGCGKIQYPAHVLKRQLSVEECLAAVDECGAPMVSIPGGEPLLHEGMPELVRELVKRKKYIYLCTNALLLKEKLEAGWFEPSKYLSFSVHMDGLQENHDFAVCREGTYEKAIAGIRMAVERGNRPKLAGGGRHRFDPSRRGSRGSGAARQNSPDLAPRGLQHPAGSR